MLFKHKKATPTAPEPEAPAPEPEHAPRKCGNPKSQFLTGDRFADAATVDMLLETIAQVSKSRDLEALLVDFVDRSIELTGAERGFLLLRGGRERSPAERRAAPCGGLVQRVSRARGGRPYEGDGRYCTTIAGRVLERIRPERAMVGSDAEALSLAESFNALRLRSVLCAPLAAQELEESEGEPRRASGVLYVDSRSSDRPFKERELSLLAVLAQYCSIALDNARLLEDRLEKSRLEEARDLAGAIQRDLMPKIPTDLAHWDVHACYEPADVAAGDFYDFLEPRCGGLGLAVGDAMGHGIGPALISSQAQGALDAYLKVVEDAGEAVSRLNGDICEKVDDGRFLTLALTVLSDAGEVESVNAGHTSPLIWRSATGEIEEIQGGGPALGMIEGETFRAAVPARLESGDVLCLYTDGLTEARSREDADNLFGEEGLRRVLANSAVEGKSAREIALALVNAALELAAGEREDDITLVVVRRR